ncbi:MAG: hypothetical protein R3E32_17525 [Chitinophagales bacterium]
MVSNSYNVTFRLGYEDISQLVRQLSDSDKEKLVQEIYKYIPQEEKKGQDTLKYLNEMAKRFQKRNQSVGLSFSTKIPNVSFSKLKMVSVNDADKVSASYKMNKEAVVGKWAGDESVEELLSMLTK